MTTENQEIIFHQGWLAAKTNKSYFDSPYSIGSEEWYLWKNGYDSYLDSMY